MPEKLVTRNDTVLGLDLGTTSVGWALLRQGDLQEKSVLLRTGVRHFEPGSQNLGRGKSGEKAEASNSTARRQFRNQRRQLKRRAGRLATLYRVLADAGLLERLVLPNLKQLQDESPSAFRRRIENAEREARNEALRRLDKQLWSRIKTENLADSCDTLPFLPFILRSHGLDRKLEPMEFGRALYHMAQHRGFSTNRSASQQERDAIDAATAEAESTPPTKPKKKDEGGKFAEALTRYTARLNTTDPRGKSQRTIGEIQYRMIQNREVTDNGERQVTVRRQGEPAWRSMYEDEFHALWDRQASFDPEWAKHAVTVKFRRSERGGGDPDVVLTRQEPLRAVVADTVFFQRPLKSSTHLIGDCDFENGLNWLRGEGVPTKAAPRLPWAHPLAQRFRMIAMVNNAGLLRGGKDAEPLSPTQRRDLIALLSRSPVPVTFADAKAALGLDKTVKFNFERKDSASKKSFEVLQTEHVFRHAFGTKWDGLTEIDREAVFHDWYSIQKTNALKLRFALHWGLGVECATASTLTGSALTAEIARRQRQAKADKKQYGFTEATREFGTLTFTGAVEAIARAQLATGYCNLSARAIRRLLPLMEDRNHPMTLGEAREFLYERRATAPVDQLAPLNSVVPELTSPVVRRALTEMRKVVNSLLQEEGYKPGRIHVEVARALRVGKDGRKDIIDRQKLDRQANENAEKIAREMGLLDERGRPLVEKVKLAQECGWCCPYTGQPFGADELRNGAVEIEHIIPQSMIPGDSFDNLTLAYREANARKGDNPPHAAFAHSPAGYDWAGILNRVARFKSKEDYAKLSVQKREDCSKKGKAPKEARGKHRLFLLQGTRSNPSEELKQHCEGFTHADLNHTSWMTRAACGYLATLYGIPVSAPHLKDKGDSGQRRIYAVGGGVTGFLRRTLGKYITAPKEGGVQEKYWRDLNTILWPTQDIAIPGRTRDGKKSRADHRHHAIDAIVVALATPAIVSRINEASASAAGRRKHELRLAVRGAAQSAWPSIYDDVQAAMYGGVDSQGVVWPELVVSERCNRKLQGELHNATLLKKNAGRAAIGESVRKRFVKNSNNPLILIFRHRGRWGGRVVSLLQALGVHRAGDPLSSLLEPDQEFQFIVWKGDSLELRNNEARIPGQNERCVYYVDALEDDGDRIKASPHWWGAESDRDHPATIRKSAAKVLTEFKLRRVRVSPTGRVSYVEPVHD